ncbi:MAG: histidine kinase [Gemmatimonadota bacterium]
MTLARGGWRSALTIATAAFAVLTLISSVQIYTLRAAERESVTVLDSLVFGAATWIVWAMASPLILRLGQHFGFGRGQRVRSLLVHLTVAVGVHLPATFLIFYAGTRLFGGEKLPPTGVLLQQALAGTRLPFALLLYASLLGLARALDLVEHLRAEEARAARLETQATQARLDALAARLQPHFLFNSLHTIGALIDEDPPRARALVAQFGELLRDALDGSDVRDITLAEEVRLLERYLAIEQLRFADRLMVTVSCAPDAAAVLVPRFLLQPLVENALHHGIAPHARGGTISIDACRSGSTVTIRIVNDGVQLPDKHTERQGLRTTRERLSARYGRDATLTMATAKPAPQHANGSSHVSPRENAELDLGRLCTTVATVVLPVGRAEGHSA